MAIRLGVICLTGKESGYFCPCCDNLNEAEFKSSGLFFFWWSKFQDRTTPRLLHSYFSCVLVTHVVREEKALNNLRLDEERSMGEFKVADRLLEPSGLSRRFILFTGVIEQVSGIKIHHKKLYLVKTVI